MRTSDVNSEWLECLSCILSGVVTTRSGGGTVRDVLEGLVASARSPGAITFKEAQRLLGREGLRIIRPTQARRAWELMIPNQHTRLDELYAGTRWSAGREGGLWRFAIRQAPSREWRLVVQTIERVKYRGTAFRVDFLLRSSATAER